MDDQFFKSPILNSPYAYPSCHWELDDSGQPTNRVIEIKGYRGEDTKAKKETMATYCVPGVNNLHAYGRCAFAEFTEVYEIQSDFEARVAAEFNRLMKPFRPQAETAAAEGLVNAEG